MKSVSRIITEMIFPDKCPFCGEIVKTSDTKPEKCCACENCIEDIEMFSNGGNGRISGLECVPSADRVYCLFAYRGKGKDAVCRFKFNGLLWIGDKLGKSLFCMLEKENVFNEIFYITYVPITEERFRERGFNQSKVIADILSDNSGRTVLPLLKRNYQGTRNSESNLEDRKGRGDKYSVEEKYIPYIKNKNVLLVDDILTTGATLEECASALKKAGAGMVYCCVLSSGRHDI